MTVALHTPHTDLARTPAKNKKPAQVAPRYSTQSKAMTMAWASYRKWKADWLKEYGEALPHRQYKFNQCLRDAYQTIRIVAMGTATISREEAQFIGSDCLSQMQEAA